MQTMTHRERVRAALDHREPDRVPLDLCSTRDSAIVINACRNFYNYVGVIGEPKLLDRMMQVVDVDEEIKKRFDIDFRGVFLGAPDKGGDIELGEGRYKDEWGVVRVKPPGSYYYDLEICPLSGEISIHDIIHYPWPDPDDSGRTKGLESAVNKLYQETDYAIVLNLVAPFVHISQYLRGFEDWFIDCVVGHKTLCALFDAILEVNMGICQNALKNCKGIDVVMLADDLGTQNGPMVSPEVFRKIFKSRFKRIFTLIHDLTSANVLFHTCGAVSMLLGDLIDAGIDILHPVQVSAVGMDTSVLKKRYGNLITFWGAIDTQSVLPYGNTEMVKEEVRKRINDLSPGGGYILGAVHNLQPDVDPKNIITMYDYAREFGRYRFL